MDSIYTLLKDNGIELVMIKLEKNGYYNSKLKMMFVNQELNEEKQKEVILHELGHALNHKDSSILYNNPVYRSKMENEATGYMLDYLINESDGQFNYSDVLEKLKLGLGWECKLK
ncbi:ImmA/IrrE family metallo-endopeptidase [Pisciglobus halotolerans]|uniref:IrrE N-terminal-like domain-containing protein n=1 Tax=Pisciglobus halotolerans TaxID=745365 RepID=A0A1I3CH32_9LACT|nr:ImmA/IrrE family metallo-endopeptidase [Pisciglobus halotolerans]SFH73713.1 protein of unknown function [Pisciglobus halotolerans]